MVYTRRETQRISDAARFTSAEGRERFSLLLPHWKVENRSEVGDPGRELLSVADEWKPDLLVIGSHGRSAIGRFFLGSVSKEVAERTDRPIRVVRPHRERNGDGPNRILIGANTLPNMEKVLNLVGKRVWPDRTEISLIAVDDGVSANRVSAVYPYGRAIFEQAAEGRLAKGIPVTVDVRSGNLKSILLDEAEGRKADSIFITANAKDPVAGLDETAAYLITGARCTVELVR